MIGSQLSGRSAGKFTPAQTVKYAYAFMATAAIADLAYTFATTPSVPWAVIPIMIYGIGFAMAMPSITIITLDLFPTRRGMAASLQGFVSGMVNVLTAGAIAPVLWGDTRWLALGMFAIMAAGLVLLAALPAPRASQGAAAPRDGIGDGFPPRDSDGESRRLYQSGDLARRARCAMKSCVRTRAISMRCTWRRRSPFARRGPRIPFASRRARSRSNLITRTCCPTVARPCA
jgi:MFS family permease